MRPISVGSPNIFSTPVASRPYRALLQRRAISKIETHPLCRLYSALCFKSFPSVNMSTTFISDCVRVPVLSVQITVTRQSVSEAGSFRMRTFFLTSLFVANARPRATTAGSPSGMAETAKLTATRKESAKPHPAK